MNNKELSYNNEENEKEINNVNVILEDDLPNQDIFSIQNNDSNKEELKKLFLEEIFYQKNIADNYEIPLKFFKEVEMPPYGNCLYCCISYFLYNNKDNHAFIRNSVYQYISENPETFYIFFQGNDNENLNIYSPKTLLEKYISENNREGQYAGDLEYAALCKIFNIKIILLIKGYKGLNVFNIYLDKNNEMNNSNNIYILFINENHFNYLELINNDKLENEIFNKTVTDSIQNNLIEWEKIRKKEYPISLKWYPDIYREMYNFYKYGIISEERFNNTSNPRVYISRFKELAKKSFYYESDRLYFIKVNNSIRLPNGGFEDINKVQLKRIPYTYEILPKLDQLHETNGHIAYRTLAKKFLEDEFFIDNIEIITREYTSQCPECYKNFYSRKLIKSPKIIYDEGSHYKLLVDITYLDKKYYSKKTKYKYIIDCIDHFSKFYLGYLIRDKISKTALNKIKNLYSYYN